MRESIGSALIFNLMIVFISILALLFVGSIGYSKAYKVKNKIIEEIEKTETYDRATAEEIEKWLNGESDGDIREGGIGYKKLTSGMTSSCPNYEDDGLTYVPISTDSRYHYCVYKANTCSTDKQSSGSANCGTYYRVIAFMYINLPVIEDLLEIPVMGETMTFKNIYNVKESV